MHQPTHRRTLSGKRIPLVVPRPRTWHELIAAARAPQPIGGGYCPCGGVTDFYSDEDRETWHLVHEDCVEDETPHAVTA
jgi:hypothetical protein